MNMTLGEFHKILKETITNEMFEALMLNVWVSGPWENYRVMGCDIQPYGKIYRLQDNRAGDAYRLVFPTAGAALPDAPALEQCIVAEKNEVTLFTLADHLWRVGQMGAGMVPYNCRQLWHFLSALDRRPETFFWHRCANLTGKADKMVSNRVTEELHRGWELLRQCFDRAAGILLDKEFLTSKNDWDTRDYLIDLSGKKAKARMVEYSAGIRGGFLRFHIRQVRLPSGFRIISKDSETVYRESEWGSYHPFLRESVLFTACCPLTGESDLAEAAEKLAQAVIAANDAEFMPAP